MKKIISKIIIIISLAISSQFSYSDENKLILAGDIKKIQVSPSITTQNGVVQGVDDGKILAWLGIPYAQPPIGELRWKPSIPSKKWEKTFVADHIASQCAQGPDLGAFATPGGNEDCLYLNIYADKKALNRAITGEQKLPVFVWIHGGGLQVGQGADYDATALVKDGKAIVVTFNYRLGMFGFFAHPKIDKEGQAYGNYGLMDQVLALKWIKDNIAAFGGDINNITIAGESAGGVSVLALVLSPWADGLFQHAIEMSGSAILLQDPRPNSTLELATAEEKGIGFSKAIGCESNKDIASCLRKLSTDEVLSLRKEYLVGMPIIDGDFLPNLPLTLLQNGKFNHVNIVSGNNLDEGDFFAYIPEEISGKPMTDEQYSNIIIGMFGNEFGEKILKQYPIDNYLNPSKAYSSIITDYLFNCPSIKFKDLASQYTQVRAYQFADRTAPSYVPSMSFEMAASHTFELPYLFPKFQGGATGKIVKLNSMQQNLASQMQYYWTHMSETNNWKEWPKYNNVNRNILQFQLVGSKVMKSGLYEKIHNCKFWDALKVY